MTENLGVEPSAVAVGFFDGVHKGHQRVIETAQREAKEKGLKSAVMSFDPHPSVVLKKGKVHARYITPLPEKEKILKKMGIDYFFVITFNQELAQLAPQTFVDHFFVNLQIRHVVAGFDFSYGHKGRGSMETLPDHARGRLTHTIISKVEEDEEKISSTRIRQLLDHGYVEEAESLLGRPFSVVGDVKGTNEVQDYSLVNLDIDSDFYPLKMGVYAVKISCDDQWFSGIASVLREQENPSLNVYLFDGKRELYGTTVRVDFHRFIREEQTFERTEDLKAQIEKDASHTREFFRID
ncbi:riboflavin biosynthesis protein RibF [Halobacillus fulvus]|nr:riboflavin biosynthesis protein RibF [Halobacillus fulvus]